MMTEKRTINGGIIAMENYGTISRPEDDDMVNILAEDELDTTSSSVEENAPTVSHVGYDPTLDKGCYFNDGTRKIDFVLVYDEDMETIEMKKQGTLGSKPHNGKAKLTTREKNEMWRQKFLTNLRKAGLQMEEDAIESDKKIMYYLKLHAPWDVLCFYAEDLCMRAPLQAHPNPSSNWSEKILATIRLPNIMAEDVPNQPLDYYTCQFKKSKIRRFLGNENPDTFFSAKDRQRIVYEILATSTYGKRKQAEIGVDRLLEEDVYLGAFPLHDGPYERPKVAMPAACLNPRQVLYEYWARWGKWYKYQPLDHIRDYFGEKIGIYFAWLGFYTAWLLPAAIVGLLIFLYGVITINYNTVAQETCNSGNDFKMCPLCDEDIGCAYWYLSSVCVYTKISYLFDHPGTVFYAVFVSFWAVTFLEYWKRKTASLAHHWDCLDFQEEEERPRPEYAAVAPALEKNPITGVKEPYFPQKLRIPRILSGMAVILVMMILVVIFIVAVILYRVLVSIPLFQNKLLRGQATTIASLSAAVVNLILIMALGKVYEKLALKLTQWEMHRTQSDFDDNLIFKVFIFQFVNFYSSIIYIGFFKGKFVGYPGHYTRMFGLRSEECQNGGCLIELAMQLAVIMIGKQAINNAQELFLPKIKAFIHRWRTIGHHKMETVKTRWEADFELIENEGLFEEYLEMVLQFGFITIFVAAFPLAPLFALLNNWLEIRLDAHKFVCETRRPVAERSQDIGVWFTILDALAQLAVISNAFLIAFTSEFLPKILYEYTVSHDMSLKGYVNFTLAWAPNGTLHEPCRYQEFRDRNGDYTNFYWQLLVIRLAFVIVFEHVVFFACRGIDLLVPDVPKSLAIKIKRERYLAKQALADTDTIMKIAKGEDDDEDDTEGARVLTLNVPDNKEASNFTA